MTDLAKTPGPSIVYTASEAQAVYDRGFAAGRATALKEVAEQVRGLPQMDMVIGPWPNAGTAPAVLLPAVLALLSTEDGS